MSVAILEESIIRITGWKSADFQSVGYPEDVTLVINAPWSITDIVAKPPFYIDVAMCVEAPDRRGWESYFGQKKDNGIYIADLNGTLIANHDEMPYTVGYHRLTRVTGSMNAFRGMLCLAGSDIHLIDDLAFSITGKDLTAHLTRSRATNPELRKKIDFRFTFAR